ncbi:hypothetical protein PCASD_26316 [Puccinia coronata f. sp. avenae]|uniref:Uncharacterized protein n=1 Tax=Puccinia coronata f. sp. avenae TaxID=200324 RepID=A0A2N5RVD8_9BASI|nr:hypothetical protein PCASD_26316 [Puccinia coronata f. sp. avenae]
MEYDIDCPNDPSKHDARAGQTGKTLTADIKELIREGRQAEQKAEDLHRRYLADLHAREKLIQRQLPMSLAAAQSCIEQLESDRARHLQQISDLKGKIDFTQDQARPTSKTLELDPICNGRVVDIASAKVGVILTNTEVESTWTEVESAWTEIESAQTEVESAKAEVASTQAEVVSSKAEVASSRAEVVSMYSDKLTTGVDVMSMQSCLSRAFCQ